MVYEAPKLEAANFETAAPEEAQAPVDGTAHLAATEALADVPFTHLHVHSQFSVTLQAVSPVGELVAAAKRWGCRLWLSPTTAT